MLTSKSVASTKLTAKTTVKAVAKKTIAYAASSNNGAVLQVAQNMAVYTTREQRLRSERSVFSGLLFQRASSSDMDVVKLVHNRLPVSVIDRLLAEGVTKQEINLIAPPRTLAHRRANEEPLTIEESDRAVRLARVVAQTESVFGNKDKAMGWLRQPMKRFEGSTPIEMLVSDVGSRLVEEVLVQIDEGFFA
jgi:putative toxin-antitoxin system antitoxin component (TIGR02293 family)